MVLRLNTNREMYKEYFGMGIVKMPQLISDNRVPMNISQLMKRRLEVKDAEEEVKLDYMDNFFDSEDVVVYTPEDIIGVMFDAEILREINPRTKLSNGALLINNNQISSYIPSYKSEGLKQDFEESEKINTLLSKEEAKSHFIWQLLSRDQSLLNDYADFIFEETKRRFGMDRAMGVYFSRAEKEFETDEEKKSIKVRTLCLDQLVQGAGIQGRCHLDYSNCRFIGIASEMLDNPEEFSSKIKAYTLEDIREAKKQLDKISEFAKPKHLDKLYSLFAKL